MLKRTAALAAALTLATIPAYAAPARDLSVKYSNGTMTSTYHLFGEGTGLLVWMDGSGGYAIDHPGSAYAIGGKNGLEAVAREHGMMLLVPEAPAPDCDGESNCWYDRRNAVKKAEWARDLIVKIKTDYNLTGPVVVGGYSSGAQATTTIVAAHGKDLGVTLGVPVSFGSPPRGVTDLPDGYKPTMVFNTGTGDREAYPYAREGAAWFREHGARVITQWPKGVGHDRSGDFGRIVAGALDYLPTTEPSPTPTPTPVPCGETQPTQATAGRYNR